MTRRQAGGWVALALLLAGVCGLLTGAGSPVGHTKALYVNDYAGVLSDSDSAHILAVGRQLERQTGAQVALLTVESLEEEDIATYALRVAEDWQLGKAGEDNGALIVLAVADRLSRIEVGYGLEGTLTDVLTGRIQDTYMLPHYREDDFSTGLREGYGAVAAAVYSHYGVEAPDTLPTVEADSQSAGGLGLLPILLLLLVVFGGRMGLLPLLFFPGGRGGGRGGGGGSTFGGGGRFGGGGSSRRF